jgi:2-oxoglutarate ferredoxin oxidoreductase subunit gamma
MIEPVLDHTNERLPVQQYRQEGRMMEKYILFAGHSRQGILYVGQVLIESAMEGGWYASCVESGRQGDVVHCWIRISSDPLHRGGAAMPDVAMLASLPAADAFERTIKPGGLLVLNAADIRRPVLRRDVDVVMVPTNQATGADPSLPTLTLLGALVALTGWMSIEEVMGVVRKSCVGDAACTAFLDGAMFVEEMLMNVSSKAA